MRANAPFEPERGQYRPASTTVAHSSSSYYSGPFGWWFRLSVPPEPPASADFATRDRARRGRLGGSLLFGLLLLMILAIFIGLGDPVSLISAMIGLGAVVIATILNRSGFVNIAGMIMVALPALVIILAILGGNVSQKTVEPGEAFLYLPLFDLLAISEVIAASLLAPIGVLFVMLALIGFTVGDMLLQQQNVAALAPYFLTSDGLLQFIGRPVAFQLIIGLIGFLWARSTVQSIRRADRAEELAELERRELERTHELEEGVRQLLAVHVHLANGDFNVRAPAIRNSLLWQIGSSLNNLVARLGRLAQAEFVLRRTQEEANRVTEAIYMLNSGRQPIWPGPSNTPLDRLVDVLRTSLTPRGAAGGANAGAGGGGGGAIPGGPQAPQLPSSATGAYPGAPGMAMNQPPSIAPGMPMPGMSGTPGGMMGAVPDRAPSPTGYPGSAPVPNSMNNPNNPNNPVPDWMRPLMPADGSAGSGGAGQAQRPMVDGSRAPISGPGSGPASGFGAPVAPGYGPPQQQPQPQSPQSDVNPWSLEPSEPLDDTDLPEWLRQPNQE